MLNTNNIQFNSHLIHNPECDILQYQVNNDVNITFGIYIKDGSKPKGTKFMGVYFGENYNVNSNKKSYSRCYYNIDKMSRAYFNIWLKLKNIYVEKFMIC